MRIWHRGWIKAQDADHWLMRGLEAKPFPTPGSPTPKRWQFDIAEDHPLWPDLKKYLAGDHTFINTVFTDEERLASAYCIARPTFSIGGFRQEGGGWIGSYYDDVCPTCGSGWRQIAPFRITKEPRLGRNQFASFGAAFEFLLTPMALKTFQENGFKGHKDQPLIIHSENRPAQTIEQLVVTSVAGPAIAQELAEHERYRWTDCASCGRRWHLFYTRGQLPLRKSALHTDSDFQLTNEWFGSGAAARREILVSQRVVHLILENKWRGIELIPVRVV